MNYRVIEAHQGNYSKSIIIKKGTNLRVENKYNGSEDWENVRN